MSDHQALRVQGLSNSRGYSSFQYREIETASGRLPVGASVSRISTHQELDPTESRLPRDSSVSVHRRLINGI